MTLLDPAVLLLAYQHVPGMNAGELSRVLYTCARLGKPPRGVHLRRCFVRLHQLSGAAQPQVCVCCLVSACACACVVILQGAAPIGLLQEG